jgi:hypothetical protein
MKILDNSTGNEVFRLELPNPPEKFKDIDFYTSNEWETIKPEVIKGFYQLHSLIFVKRL